RIECTTERGDFVIADREDFMSVSSRRNLLRSGLQFLESSTNPSCQPSVECQCNCRHEHCCRPDDTAMPGDFRLYLQKGQCHAHEGDSAGGVIDSQGQIHHGKVDGFTVSLCRPQAGGEGGLYLRPKRMVLHASRMF